MDTVHKIREFNRFYMPAFNLLGNSYLGSEYSAAEARVLFEIYEHDSCNAAYIAERMNIDKSYLSRIIHSHEKRGYLFRSVSQSDQRAFELHLTEKGAARTEELIELSDSEIGEVIGGLSEKERGSLTAAMDTVMDILSKCINKEG